MRSGKMRSGNVRSGKNRSTHSIAISLSHTLRIRQSLMLQYELFIVIT